MRLDTPAACKVLIGKFRAGGPLGVPWSISLLVLLAAALHASWNAVLRSGADRLWSMTIMCIAVAIICAAAAPFVPMPAPASWGYAVTSALLHSGYNLFLVRAYRSGDLGQTYPIARGLAPILVSIGGALFAREVLDPVSVAGVLLVSSGIISLAFQGKGFATDALPYALGAGCFIGAYSVVDAIGVRRSGTPVGYTVWLCFMWGAVAPLIYVVVRDWRSLLRGARETLGAAGGGAVSLLAYGIIVFAMSIGPMGPVSALRETSVVMAALIGRFFLNERLTAYRLAACVVVAIGAVFIGHADSSRRVDPSNHARGGARLSRPGRRGALLLARQESAIKAP
jgi:drug/metabolite transporter (DMT)-like permease